MAGSRVTLRLTTVAALLCLATLNAQNPAPPRITATMLEVKAAPGALITIRIAAPQASDVKALVDTMATAAAKPLTRDDQGVWSGTLGPLQPDVYIVSCIVNGALGDAGAVVVPGATPEAWEVRKVPHGAVQQRWYDSRSLGVLRSVYVYTPP